MVQSARGHRLARAGKQLARGADDRVEHLGRVLLDPAGVRVGESLLAARLGQRPQVGVVQDRLDGGGPLVDAEQQCHAATDAR